MDRPREPDIELSASVLPEAATPLATIERGFEVLVIGGTAALFGAGAFALAFAGWGSALVGAGVATVVALAAGVVTWCWRIGFGLLFDWLGRTTGSNVAPPWPQPGPARVRVTARGLALEVASRHRVWPWRAVVASRGAAPGTIDCELSGGVRVRLATQLDAVTPLLERMEAHRARSAGEAG